MKAVTLTTEDLRGFLDTDEVVTESQLATINDEYRKLVEGASDDFKAYFDAEYTDDEYYPPFVAQAVNDVLK